MSDDLIQDSKQLQHDALMLIKTFFMLKKNPDYSWMGDFKLKTKLKDGKMYRALVEVIEDDKHDAD